MAEKILLKARDKINCPFLMVVDETGNGHLWCPNGSFYKHDIIGHFGGWALKPCFACSLSKPAFDPFDIKGLTGGL